MNISEREREVLQQAATGKTNREAAKALFMSVQAFKWNLRKLKDRFGCNNTKELLSYAISHNLIERISLKANSTNPNDN